MGMLSKIPVPTRIGITVVALVIYTIGFLATHKYFGTWWIIWLPFGMFILAVLFPWIDQGGEKHEVSPGESFPGS
jgi:hypothetical protein